MMGLFFAYTERGFFGDGKWVIWFNIIGGMFNLFFAHFEAYKKESDESKKYGNMINSLSEMTKNIESLKTFLETELTRVDATKAIIEGLEKERAELEPVVTAHRNTVDTILRAYQNRSNESVWINRIIGFIIGILSSITAAYLLKLFESK